MLAYAAHRRSLAQRGSAPNAMLVIIAIHVAGIAALMSAKMDIPLFPKTQPTIVDFIPPDEPPPPVEQTPRTSEQPRSSLDQLVPRIPTPPLPTPNRDPAPLPLPDLGKIIGPAVDPPRPLPLPTPPVVERSGAKLLTPADRLKPPYPSAKLASGEEALLRLRLAIDERGRVVAVDSVGPADGAFLAAARRHLLAQWRYKPAMEGGRAVASSIVITLRFQLEA